MSGTTGLLIGYGSIGRRHLTNLHALGVTDWAVVHTGNGTLALEPPGLVRVYPTVKAALAVERPALCVVANPTSLHVPVTRELVEAGCDVLLEKPVATRPDGLESLTALVATRDARVLVGFQFRLDRGLRRLADLLDQGVIGRPVHVQAVWGEYLPAWHPWEDWRASYAARAELGGGVHHTLCHPFDYLRMLFGEARVVSASVRRRGPLGLTVAESTDATLRFEGGIEAHVHLDYWSRPPRHRVEVVGVGGTITWDHVAGELRIHAGDASLVVEAVPGVADRDALFLDEARHLLDVVARRAEPACSLSDGIAAVAICAAIDDMVEPWDGEQLWPST